MTSLPPIESVVTVRCSVEDAFETFTRDIGAWWPLRSHSVGRDRAANAVLERRVGGNLYEVTTDGERHVWAEVSTFEPPHRMVLMWHAGRAPETAQEVEIRFRYAGDVTEVVLMHRGWEELADALRTSYVSGWSLILGQHFKEAAERRLEVT